MKITSMGNHCYMLENDAGSMFLAKLFTTQLTKEELIDVLHQIDEPLFIDVDPYQYDKSYLEEIDNHALPINVSVCFNEKDKVQYPIILTIAEMTGYKDDVSLRTLHHTKFTIEDIKEIKFDHHKMKMIFDYICRNYVKEPLREFK